MVLNVVEELLNAGVATGRYNTVGVVPEPLLPEIGPQMLLELFPEVPGAHRFQVPYKARQVHRRVRVHQQVDMVGFAAELHQSAAPAGTDLLEYVAHALEHGPCQALVSVFNRQDNVVMQAESRMVARV